MALERKKKSKEKGGAPEYMLTYGDMVTLLLTFFVLMFSVGEQDPREMRLILSAFSGSLGMFTGGKTLSKGALVEMGMTIESLPAKQKGSSLARAKKEAQQILKPELRTRMVRVMEDERGIRISLSSDVCFEPGSAKLKLDKTSELLKKVGFLVNKLTNNRIRIEGHTDDTPIEPGSNIGKRYASNWELSTARAISVLNYLKKHSTDAKKFKEKRFEVAGYSKFRPIVKGKEGNTPEYRADNRRVDIVIIRDEKNYKVRR